MADDKKKVKEEKKVVLERTYVVPLRKEWLKVPRWRRSKKAVTALREFIIKHMKAESIKLGKYINKDIWKHGIKNPPHKVKVNCSKDDKGVVTVEMVGAPVEKKKEAKAITKKSKSDIKGAIDELKKKTEEAKGKPQDKEAPKEEKKEAAKPEVKKEAKPEPVKEEKKPEVKKEESKEPAK